MSENTGSSTEQGLPFDGNSYEMVKDHIRIMPVAEKKIILKHIENITDSTDPKLKIMLQNIRRFSYEDAERSRE